MDIALHRPCPHCAHDRCELHELQDQPGVAWAVRCEECGAVNATSHIAAMKWNLRYGPRSSDARARQMDALIRA